MGGRSHSNDPGLVFLGATLSEKKIVKEKFFFPLFSLNRYSTAPVGQILIKKYGSVVREDPFPMTPVFLGAIVSEKKIVKEKFFFPFSHLNRYNSVPIDPDKRIWACRPRRSLANDLSPVFLYAILSEKKIVKEKFFFPLFPINRYNSAPSGQILI
ncbi:LOW QUALITY PROTEIN: hypothetical protein V1477_017793 [Vespula maculifrons]|uniref:Uncharacterized protein n=1 Tax=Vespula maculifrons TaxID=7453 RepID=A0ABD2B138_VESMC